MDKLNKPFANFIEGLLDDRDFSESVSARDWNEMTFQSVKARVSNAAIKSTPTAVVAKTFSEAKPSQNLHTTRTGTKIFRNKKSLKELMQEYNGRASSLPPLKSSLIRSGEPSRPHQADFRYDRVEIMEANVPAGKILRPS